MSIKEPVGCKATETTESPSNRPLLSAEEYFARQPRRIHYGDLVSRVADEYELTAAEAKAEISERGRDDIVTELYSEQCFIEGRL